MDYATAFALKPICNDYSENFFVLQGGQWKVRMSALERICVHSQGQQQFLG